MKSVGMKKAAAMKKAMKAKKAKRLSVIARGKRAKVSVFRGTKEKTGSGLTKAGLTKNKAGRIVSKARSALSKKAFATSALKKWADATKAARKALGITGFVPVGGKSAAGKALYAKAKSLLAA